MQSEKDVRGRVCLRPGAISTLGFADLVRGKSALTKCHADLRVGTAGCAGAHKARAARGHPYRTQTGSSQKDQAKARSKGPSKDCKEARASRQRN